MKTLNRSFGFLIVVILFFAAAVQNTTADEDKEAIQQLKDAGKSASVEEELDEPDGVSLDLTDPDNWKIFAKGSATYDFNDREDSKDALQVAKLIAKKSLADFFKEKISSAIAFKKLVNKEKEQASGVGKNVSKTTVASTLTDIRNSAEAILSGFITLETSTEWHGSEGTATVTIGQSKKTAGAVKRFRRRTAEAAEEPSTSDSVKEQDSSKSPSKRIREKSKSDF